jgi:hypothetical protein
MKNVVSSSSSTSPVVALYILTSPETLFTREILTALGILRIFSAVIDTFDL